MENKKIKQNIEAAEFNLELEYPENPEFNQIHMLRGIGYAVLALVEILKNPKPAPKSMSTGT